MPCHRRHAVDQQRAVGALDDVGRVALVVGQIARQRLQQVGLRDDAFEAAIFVDDDSHPHRRLLEELQHLEDRHALMDQQRLAHRRGRIELAAGEHLGQEILLGDHAHDLVDAAASDQQLAHGCFRSPPGAPPRDRR